MIDMPDTFSILPGTMTLLAKGWRKPPDVTTPGDRSVALVPLERDLEYVRVIPAYVGNLKATVYDTDYYSPVR